LIELAGDRQPHVCQAQSLNIFLPSDVHKADLNRIHWLAWKKGVKSLYYLRSKTLQRSESHVSSKARGMQKEEPQLPIDCEPCLSCQ